MRITFNCCLIGAICSDPEIIQLVLKLKNDPSKDVQFLLKEIELFCNEEKANRAHVQGTGEFFNFGSQKIRRD